MKRSTIIGCFVGLLSLTISAQSTQPSSSKSDSGTTIEVQKKPTASVQELLVRYQNLGSQSGSLSEYFTKEEQQLLHSYFNNQKPVKSSQVLSGNGKNIALASAAEPINPRSFKSEAAKKTQYTPLFVASGHTDKFGNSTGIDYSTENRPAYKQAPLFLAPTTLTAEDEAEILANEQYQANLPVNRTPSVMIQNRAPQADIIPTAGATETFTPDAGDHFFDPGGPGGSSTGGTPGNYPNCNCDTQTTLAGVSEIDFQFFSVFSNFDYLRIYDGTDATGTKLYDNGPGGANEDDITLADMIASHGSSTFTAASGNFFFFFHASSVVDYGGWDVEIVTAGGGGGGADPTVYALNLRASCGNDFGSFSLPGPYNIDPIATNTSSIFAGDFDDTNTLYGLNFGTLSLVTIDTASGAETTVGPLTNLAAAHTPSGLAWNEADGTMYASSTDGVVTTIYSVDLATGTLTAIGDSGNPLGIWLAIDNAGNAFMADIGDDNLYSIDLNTGAGTLVGPLGIDISFAQDADFDPDSGVLYMAAYIGGGVNQFCSVDTATGTVTQLGSINSNCAEVGILAIEGTGGGGGGSACSQSDVSNGFENGYGNTNNTVEIADEIIVAADTDFEVDQLTINMINNGGFNSIDVGFYEDAGGMPGTMIGSIMTIVPTSSTVIGTAFGRDVLSIVLDIAPTVMLNGTSGSETVYWIGVETPNPVDPTSDAYWETTSIPNPGTDYRVHYDVANSGWNSTLPADDMWNTVYTVSGNCEPIGGGGGCTPGSLATLYAGGNGGDPGGAVYFDITVGASDIEVSTFDMNTPQSGNFTMDVYMFEGTYVG
ncbi:MAG: hypothetical protein KDC94_02985, partial [Aequorivita sp.]|nr:hypothetical protein [Aequorivita sp.]